MHVHVAHPDGEAKVWLEPSIAVATQIGLLAQQVKEAERIVRAHQQEIENAWRKHFGG